MWTAVNRDQWSPSVVAIVIVVVIVVMVVVVVVAVVAVMIMVDAALLDHGGVAGPLVDDAAGKRHQDGRDDQAKECALHDKG
jgi:flagellar basal body-associated protein FliL